MHLDNSLSDFSGNNTIKQKGTVKFYSNGVNGACGEFGKTGFAVTDNVTFGEESFSMVFWAETDKSITEAPAIMGNQDW